jgi:hypothetical protein
VRHGSIILAWDNHSVCVDEFGNSSDVSDVWSVDTDKFLETRECEDELQSARTSDRGALLGRWNVPLQRY